MSNGLKNAFDSVKLVDKKTKMIIFGYVRSIQNTLNTPDLVIHTTFMGKLHLNHANDMLPAWMCTKVANLSPYLDAFWWTNITQTRQRRTKNPYFNL